MNGEISTGQFSYVVCLFRAVVSFHVLVFCWCSMVRVTAMKTMTKMMKMMKTRMTMKTKTMKTNLFDLIPMKWIANDDGACAYDWCDDFLIAFVLLIAFFPLLRGVLWI